MLLFWLEPTTSNIKLTMASHSYKEFIILVSILDYFQEKLKTKFSKKIQKTLFWGHFGPLLPKFVQNWNFLERRALSVFRYSNYLPSCWKSEKNYWVISEKNAELTDGQADELTARQWWFYRTLRRTGVQKCF